jgi:ketosteroid isomerase-like protein
MMIMRKEPMRKEMKGGMKKKRPDIEVEEELIDDSSSAVEDLMILAKRLARMMKKCVGWT